MERLKLEKQWELLDTERGVILAQIDPLKTLEDVKIIPVCIVIRNKLHSGLQSNEHKPSAKRFRISDRNRHKKIRGGSQVSLILFKVACSSNASS